MTPTRRAELAHLCEAYANAMQTLNDAVLNGSSAEVGMELSRAKDKAYAALKAEAVIALPEALAEVDRLTARWEALKVNIDAPAVVCSFRGDAYEQALLDVVREMTRLEQEP